MELNDNMAIYSQQKQKKRFWPFAKCVKTMHRLDAGVKKYRLKYDLMFGRGKFRRFRRYRGPDGEIRHTVEIEISIDGINS